MQPCFRIQCLQTFKLYKLAVTWRLAISFDCGFDDSEWFAFSEHSAGRAQWGKKIKSLPVNYKPISDRLRVASGSDLIFFMLEQSLFGLRFHSVQPSKDIHIECYIQVVTFVAYKQFFLSG